MMTNAAANSLLCRFFLKKFNWNINTFYFCIFARFGSLKYKNLIQANRISKGEEQTMPRGPEG